MASAVFEGTSLVNMFVRGCWVNGIRRLIVSRRGDAEEFFEIRTEWSDRSVLYLHRSFADLGRLCKRLRDAFPEDRPELARAPLRQGAGLQDWGLRGIGAMGLRGAEGYGLWEEQSDEIVSKCNEVLYYALDNHDTWVAFLNRLLAIKEAHDIETRLNEVEKLLETVISMPCK
ncbi:hypothetical protein STEG23_001186, partial [Scotinomys teguina]